MHMIRKGQARWVPYREGTPIPPSFDHQAPYIDLWLRMIGVHEVRSVIVDNAWNLNDAQSAASVAAAKQSVERIARGFWDCASALSPRESLTHRTRERNHLIRGLSQHTPQTIDYGVILSGEID